MPVKHVPTLGWTRGDVEATIRLVTRQQREVIATRVRAEMEERGWTNAKLAQTAGLAEKTISRLINARLEPRYETLDRVAKAFGVTERELRGDQRSPLGLDSATPEPFANGNGNGHGTGEMPQRLGVLEQLVSGLDEQLRLLRAETAARDAEVLRRLDEGLPPTRESRG